MGKFHRIRFYEEAWSRFDGVEQCRLPGPCWCCLYKHPFCTEDGRLIKPTPLPGEPVATLRQDTVVAAGKKE